MDDNMQIALDIPDVKEEPIRRGRYLERVYLGKGPATYLEHAILENLARLVLHAATEYMLGKKATREGWKSGWSEADKSASHLETCVVSVHRAIQYLQMTRKIAGVLPASKQALPKRLRTYKDSTRKKLKAFRDAVQHQEEHLFDGRIAPPHLFLPLGAGDEAQVDGKTVLTINRIEFGKHRILFRYLSCWIGELRSCVETLVESEYGRTA